MSHSGQPAPAGRGAHVNPPNRFDRVHSEPDLADCEHDAELLAALDRPPTEYLADKSRAVVTENDSPDISFRYSINPYRGCAHGCSYCYARPTHEYLGLSAGLDFETKVFVKHDAPALLREFLCRRGWQAETIVMSGVTDPYQPAEREYRITRGCLEVLLEARQPVGVITKNALITRDLDILREMAALGTVKVAVSVTTLDAELARAMEPRTSTPAARLRTITALTDAGIPVRLMTAPLIPGLNDREIPALLKAGAEAGAKAASYTLVRLPLAVKAVFLDWLDRNLPDSRQRIEALIRETHGGKLNTTQFGRRTCGSGEIAEQIRRVFDVFAARYHLDGDLPDFNRAAFRPPKAPDAQMQLFND
jgi:DNA repair photolyase